MLEHEVGEPAQHAGAVLRRARLPLRERSLGGGERATRLRSAHARHLGDDLAGRGIQHGEGLAGVGVDPRPVDVRLPLQERELDRGHGQR